MKIDKVRLSDDMSNYKESIYFTSRISRYMLENLMKNGVEKHHLPSHITTKQGLIEHLKSQGFENAQDLVNNAISYAFDKKYFNYYAAEKDVHEYSDEWISDFQLILKKLDVFDKLNELDILNVGCNDASQMEKMIGNNFKNLYLVDVGLRSLLVAKEIFPKAIIMNTSAESLYELPDNSIDLYLSFRTFNSRLFDIKSAVAELDRVLRYEGIVVLSIPNGYVDSDGNFSYGLKPPSEDSIDAEYPFKIVGEIMYNLSKCTFKYIGLVNSFYEIYIYAIR
ncbi:methyltransferase domain-containing protein [uncultured Methanobrevibacter sp.]|uniref:methyltransferase domain-containing protein n=1 Tax=uncultured Methanobrevibacter sp. TaxID=253161 RepID=UPI0025D065A6|nr:methyltransferase domain-containing protein [uncultured Methanobrevibacter sp.]